MELDATTAAEAPVQSADVCIIGAGPIGLALAQALRDRGRTIILVESGGSNSAQELADLDKGTVSGDGHQVLHGSRYRGLGGTAATWNTALFGGMCAKYAGLDPVDFAHRPGFEWSGWSIPPDALSGHIERACELVGDVDAGQPGVFSPGRRAAVEFPAGTLVTRTYSFGRPEIFTEVLPSRLREARDVLILRGATATGFVSNHDRDRVVTATWRSLAGTRGNVSASTYVLAAGGVENARLMLSAGDLGRTLAARHPWLGRGYMEHPVDGSLRLTTTLEQLCPVPGYYAPHGDERGHCVMGRIGLTEELVTSEQLPNASLRLIPEFVVESPVERRLNAAARRLRPGAGAERLLRGAASMTRRLVRRPSSRTYRILVDLEQAPRRDNGITLGGDVDALGVPRAHLHWTWDAADERLRERLLEVITREVERSGLGSVHRATDRDFTANSCHHVGTTRMHADPREGVVDTNLRAHGLENLYVTGASAFPTAGWANPTLTALALTLRLADHLERGG